MDAYFSAYTALTERITEVTGATDLRIFGVDFVTKLSQLRFQETSQLPALFQSFTSLTDGPAATVDTYESVIRALYGTPGWNEIVPGLRGSELIWNYMSSLLDKLDVQDGVLELGSLFDGAEQWQRILEQGFDLAPDLVANAAEVNVHVSQVRNWSL